MTDPNPHDNPSDLLERSLECVFREILPGTGAGIADAAAQLGEKA